MIIRTGSATMVDTHFLAACLYSGPEESTFGLALSFAGAALAFGLLPVLSVTVFGPTRCVLAVVEAACVGGANLDFLVQLDGLIEVAESASSMLVAVPVDDSEARVFFPRFVAVSAWTTGISFSGAAAAAAALVDGFLGCFVVALGAFIFSFAGVAASVAFLATWAFFGIVRFVDTWRMLWQRGAVMLTPLFVQPLPHLDSICAFSPSRDIVSGIVVSPSSSTETDLEKRGRYR